MSFLKLIIQVFIYHRHIISDDVNGKECNWSKNNNPAPPIRVYISSVTIYNVSAMICSPYYWTRHSINILEHLFYSFH